jgi:CHAT domain-containing protein/Flp pilus assembly protein TadD
MRIALVIFLFFMATFHILSQDNQANTWLEEGRDLSKKREYIEAIKITTKAANRYSYNGQKTQRIKALINLTEILLLADENYEAKKLATSILQLTSKEDTLAASAFHLLGRVEFNDAHFKEALNYFTKSLTIRKEKLPENHPEIAKSLQSIGITQSQLGQIDLAFENINTALNINNIALGENHLATAETLGNLGTIYSIKGENNRATKTIQKAIDIFKKENNEKQNIVVELYFQLGNAFINKDNYDLGLMNTQRGLTILEGLKGTEHPSRAPFLNNIGKIKTKSGNYMQALDFYHQALDLVEFHKGALHPDLAESNNNIAAVLHARGELDSALVFYKIALRINEDVFDESHPKVAESWGNIGDIYFELDMYDQALAFYNNAFTKYQDTYQSGHIALSKVEQQIGKTFLKKGGLKIALKHFQNSLNANVPFQYEVFDILKNPPEDKALDKNLFLSTLTLKAQTQTKLFLTNNKITHLKLAYQNFLLCDQLIDEIRRSFIEYNDQLIFNRIASQVYEEAIYNCWVLKNQTEEIKYVEQAFYFSEKSKSNALLQSFSNDKALVFADIPDSLVVQEVSLKISISVIQKYLTNALQTKDSVKTILAQERLLEAKGTYNQFVLQLENDYPHYYQLKYDNTVSTLEEVQNELKVGTTLIEFFAGEKQLFVFTINSNEIHIDHINKNQDYDNSVFSFRKSITNIEYITHRDSIEHAWKTYTNHAHNFYNLLLKKPLNHFSKIDFKKLIIIPDGMLGYIPFEILFKEKPNTEQINYATLNYLLHQYSISYAFSSTMLVQQKGSLLLNKKLNYGGFAPVYSSGKISDTSTLINYQYFKKGKYIDLPASRKGVEYIANLLDGSAFVGGQATESVFKDTSDHFDILHLAMHGVYDDKNPLNSNLAFTQLKNSNEDNHLTAAELYNMDMNTELVFVGACNSGFGKINKGEGIMSLSRAFAYAGCPSIIMSLWSVPDDETATITNIFFKQLKNGTTKDIALRKAKLKYLTDSNVPPDRHHPLFWAGFVPIGDMVPLYSPTTLSKNWTLLASLGMLMLTLFFGRLSWKRFIPKREKSIID